MKKLFIYALLVTIFSCTAFAVSDIQILLGAQLDFTDCEKKVSTTDMGVITRVTTTRTNITQAFSPAVCLESLIITFGMLEKALCR